MKYRSLCVLGLTFAGVLAITPAAGAAVSCTNDLLNGVYGLRLAGMLKPPLSGGISGAALNDAIDARLKAGSAGANAAAGYARLAMDGSGGISGSAAASILGIWSQGAVVGEYAVNEDCSVSFTLIDAAGTTQHFDGVLTRTGESASVLQTDAGTGVSGSLKRSSAFCDGAALPARLRMQTAGAVGGPAAVTTVGALEIAADRTLTSVESRFSNGAISRLASTGSIAIREDCTVSLSLVSGDGAIGYEGMLVNGGRELMLVRSDSGVMVSGDAVGQ